MTTTGCEALGIMPYIYNIYIYFLNLFSRGISAATARSSSTPRMISSSALVMVKKNLQVAENEMAKQQQQQKKPVVDQDAPAPGGKASPYLSL